MGDRANIKMIDDDGAIFLYSHWGGSELPSILHTALSKKWRWDDSAYLTRIIFCEMVKGQEDQETGFGISTHIPDNEHLVIVVNPTDQIVGLETENGSRVYGPVSFEDFVKKPKPFFKAYENGGRGK